MDTEPKYDLVKFAKPLKPNVYEIRCICPNTTYYMVLFERDAYIEHGCTYIRSIEWNMTDSGYTKAGPIALSVEEWKCIHNNPNCLYKIDL